jgi:hypothetical protein
MTTKLRGWWLIALLVSLGIVLPAGADVALTEGCYFQYTDRNGKVVLVDTLPAEVVDRGYRILTCGGELLKIVPPKRAVDGPTQACLRQKEYDRQLLLRYSTVDDLEAARLRKVREIRTRIMINESNMVGMRASLVRDQERAAELERAGSEAPQSLLDRIEVLREEIATLERNNQLRETEIKVQEEKFDRDAERLARLLDKSDPIDYGC